MAEKMDPRIEQLLTDFKEKQKATDAECAVIRRAISESPYLEQLIETTLDRGVLKGFTSKSTPGSGGHFTDHDGMLNVSRASLSHVLTQPEDIDVLVGTLAHEAGHAANQVDRQFRLKQFERQLEARFASDEEVHDATDIALAYQNRQRWDEAYAELVSVNAVVSRVRHLNPSIRDEEVLERVQTNSRCVVSDPKTGALSWAEGITVKDDRRIKYTPENIEAVASCHFDAPTEKATLGAHRDLDYRGYYAPYSMSRIVDLKIAADNYVDNPLSGPDAPLHLNLGRLGWDLAKMERDGVSFANHKVDFNFYDTTTGKPVMRNLRDTTETPTKATAPPDLSAPANYLPADPKPQASAEPADSSTRRLTPADPGHPDRALYDKVRVAVEQLDQHVGKPWGQQSERMTASALAMAAEKKFDPKDDIRLAFNQPTANLAAGEMVHVYRVGHPNPDPAANVASMKTADALSVPVEDRFQQVATTRLAQNDQTQREQQEQARNQNVSNQGGPRMSA
ncbi:XVIPCD domain-containing protein [Lysobacter sp. CA199]|uniref:XVIPCD domain-containing protein n=1 Tax=Lysobacter sp. CA199 TaxID=3455608 RepID=UPI003F8CF5AD